MTCNKCGNDIKENEKFCDECGAPVKSAMPVTAEEHKKAQHSLNAYNSSLQVPYHEQEEQETQKEKSGFSLSNWDNPMLTNFAISLLLGIICASITSISITLGASGTAAVICAIVFACLTALFLLTAFFVYYKPSRKLSRMMKGKDVVASWELSNSDIVRLAYDHKKKHRFLFIFLIILSAIALLASWVNLSSEATLLRQTLMFSSVAAFVASLGMQIFLPKIQQDKIMKNGRLVIIGEDSVFANGTYYYWSHIESRATYATFSDKRDEITIEFTRNLKDKQQKKRVTVRVTSTQLKEALALVERYEKTAKKYKADSLKQQHKEDIALQKQEQKEEIAQQKRETKELEKEQRAELKDIAQQADAVDDFDVFLMNSKEENDMDEMPSISFKDKK